MELELVLKNKITEYLQFADNLAEKIETNKVEITKNIGTLIENDKKKENVEDLVLNHRVLIATNFLLDNDLIKTLSELSVLYNLSKVSNLDLGLDESDVKRLEHNSSNEHYHFVNTSKGIKPKMDNLEENIKSRIAEKKEFSSNEFLENIRKMPIYNEKS